LEEAESSDFLKYPPSMRLFFLNKRKSKCPE